MTEEEKIAAANAKNGADGETVIDPKLSDAEKVLALEEQNKKLFERAKKGEGFVKGADGKWTKKTETVVENKTITTEKNANQNQDNQMYTREQLDLRIEGYTDKEVEFITANGGRKSLEDPNSFVSIAIKQTAEQRRAEVAASRTASTGGADTTSTKLTVEQMNAMPLKDLEKALPHAPGN